MSDEHRSTNLDQIAIVGEKTFGGTYILRIKVHIETSVTFGRFQAGTPICVPAGECLYIGSAMRGMGKRLMRHASRTDPENPQPIRKKLIAHLRRAGFVNCRAPINTTKKLHWHVDYLLEQDSVELTHVIILLSRSRLETAVARWLVQQPETFILAAGLGANDAPGDTHLLGVQAGETWWASLISRMQEKGFQSS